MSIDTLNFTSNSTVELVRLAVERAFPGVHFSIRVDVPRPPVELGHCVAAIIVSWESGPAREDVEQVVAEFQSLDWNPVSGVFEIIEHMEVTEGGSLQQVQFGVDYVLCDGPDGLSW